MVHGHHKALFLLSHESAVSHKLMNSIEWDRRKCSAPSVEVYGRAFSRCTDQNIEILFG